MDPNTLKAKCADVMYSYPKRYKNAGSQHADRRIVMIILAEQAEGTANTLSHADMGDS